MVHEDFNQIAGEPQDRHRRSPRRSATCCARTPTSIMVGEVRDGETAAQAVQAALTGHMVLTTLHTNDTVERGRAAARSRRPELPRRRDAHRRRRAAAGPAGLPVPARAGRAAHRRRGAGPRASRTREDHAGQLARAARPGLREVPLHRLLRADRHLRGAAGERAPRATSSPRARRRRCSRARRGRTGCDRCATHAVRKIAAGVTSFEEALRATADVEGERVSAVAQEIAELWSAGTPIVDS